MRGTIAIWSAVLASVALVVSPTSPTLASTGSVTVDPPSGAVTVTSLDYNGSGCPPTTATVAIQPNKDAFTVKYSKYTALVGGAGKRGDDRKNCQLGVRLQVPGGFSFAVFKATYRGYADLKKGVKATQGANYYFSGDRDTTISKHNIPGPVEDPWQTADDVPFAQLVWSPCGGNRDLQLNTDLRLSNGPGPAGTTSTLTMDSTDGALATIYHLAWKECKK